MVDTSILPELQINTSGEVLILVEEYTQLQYSLY